MKQLGVRWNRLLSLVLNLIFPPRCILCHELLDYAKGEEPPLCLSCTTSFSRKKAAGFVTGEAFQRCYSSLQYDEPFRSSFHRYKFYGHWHYSKVYGGWMADTLREYGVDTSQLDCVSWTPLSKKRLRSRGYDQSERLAREVSQRVGLPLVPLLRKRKHIAPLSRTEDADLRRKFIKDAYILRNGADVVGKRVLLVDDIITTGATLEEAGRILLENGAAEIYALTLARAGEHRDTVR